MSLSLVHKLSKSKLNIQYLVKRDRKFLFSDFLPKIKRITLQIEFEFQKNKEYISSHML